MVNSVRKSIKFLVLFFMLFILSGCATNCNLEISEDNVINLNVSISENVDYVNGFIMEDDTEGDALVKKWLNNTLSMYKKAYSDMNVSYTTVANNYVGTATKRFYDITELNDLKIIKENFNSVDVNNTNGIVNISIKGLDEEKIEEINYGENKIIVTVELPYVVLNSNASNVDKKENVYTWNLSSSKKDIILKYDTNQIYEYKEEQEEDPKRTKLIVIAGFVILGLLIAAVYVSIRSKKK